jgi:hypothetical protein
MPQKPGTRRSGTRASQALMVPGFALLALLAAAANNVFDTLSPQE